MNQQKFDDLLRAYGETTDIVARSVMFAWLSDAYAKAVGRPAAPTERATGRTSRQMLDAPTNAVYVVDFLCAGYYCRLAQHLGRGDLHIVRSDMVESWSRGRRSQFIIDHACTEFTRRTLDVIAARSL